MVPGLSEAPLYRDQDIYLVGGANSAGQAALYFARYARSVTLLVRGPSLDESMSQYLLDQISSDPEDQRRDLDARGRGQGRDQS